jgi:hypothetical protein
MFLAKIEAEALLRMKPRLIERLFNRRWVVLLVSERYCRDSRVFQWSEAAH